MAPSSFASSVLRTPPFLLAALVLASLGACSDTADDPVDPGDPTDPPAGAVVVGRVELLGGEIPAGAEVVGLWDDVEARDQVAADGTFSLELASDPGAGGGFVEVRPGAGIRAVSSLVRLDGPPPDESLRILLLPDRWTLQSGVHAGTEVEIHPADAADGKVLSSYWGFTFAFEQEGRTQTVLDSTRWTGALVTWPQESFPLPVALDRAESTSSFEAADSIRIWEALDRLEEVLGRDLFSASRPEDLPDADPDRGGAIPGAVVVRLDSTLTVRGRASGGPTVSTWFTRMEVGSWSGNDVTGFAAVSADARFGRISIRSSADLDDPALVMHEAMHVLGVGHGCVWRSIQTFCASLETEEPTAEDVAYLEVLEAAREGEKALETRHGILPAVLGERALERGLTPIPGVEVIDPDEG